MRNLKLTAMIVGGLLLAGSAAPLVADDDHQHRCEQRVHDAEHKLQHAIEKHGEHSSQAEHRRHDLEKARQDCPAAAPEEHHDHDEHHE